MARFHIRNEGIAIDILAHIARFLRIVELGEKTLFQQSTNFIDAKRSLAGTSAGLGLENSSALPQIAATSFGRFGFHVDRIPNAMVRTLVGLSLESAHQPLSTSPKNSWSNGTVSGQVYAASDAITR